VKDLTIRIKLDRAQAKAAAAEHVADAGKMTDASAKQVAAQKQGLVDVAAAARAATRDERGRFQAIGATTKATTDLGHATTGAGEAFKKAGAEGSAAFGKVALNIGMMQAGMMQALQVAATLSRAMADVARRYRELTGDFTGQRDKLGELAGIMGVDADNQFTKSNQQFNKDVGFKPDEGLQFRLGLQNAGQQHKGSKLSEAEYAEFEVQAGQIAVARGVDPGVVGDLAGTLLGSKDRRGMGDKASEDAAGKLNSGMAILGAGKGNNAVLGRQFSMLASASLNEDSLQGVFQDSDEVATVISLFAEKHDAQAAEMAKAASRGLRDFDGKAKELLKKAAINASTSWIEAMKQLAPVVLKEATDKGVKVEDVLRQNFDDLTAEAIGIGINKGVTGGAFANRAEVARANQGPGPAMDLIEKSRKTERVAQRVADAGVVVAEGEIGAANSRIQVLRSQAIEELTKDGGLGGTPAAMADVAMKIMTLGTADPVETRIKDREAVILSRRAKQAGMDVSPFELNAFSLTTEGQDRTFNSTMDAISSKGGDPLKDLPAKLDANTAAVIANTKEMEAARLKAGGQPLAGEPVRKPGVPKKI
jgi:hypothetical protein